MKLDHPLTKLSLASAGIVLLLVGLFTCGAAGALLSGNMAALENAGRLNVAYAFLSAGGEAVALAGLVAGGLGSWRQRRVTAALAGGLVLNGAGVCLFLPATFALLFNLFFALLERLA